MLYTHLLVNLYRARAAMEERDREHYAAPLARCRESLVALLLTPHRGRARASARELSELYTMLLGELVEVSRRPSPTRLELVIDIVGTLRETLTGQTPESSLHEAASQLA
jgi:flagellin-specific chaperone FliS